MATVGFNMHKYGNTEQTTTHSSQAGCTPSMRAACTAAHPPRAMLISHHCLLCTKLAVRACRVQKGPFSSSPSLRLHPMPLSASLRLLCGHMLAVEMPALDGWCCGGRQCA